MDGVYVDIKLILQNTAYPDPGGLSVFLDTYSFSFQIFSSFYIGIFVNKNKAMTKYPRRKYGYGDIGKVTANF